MKRTTDKTPATQPAGRRPYEPPQLKKVAVQLEEVVLIACKGSGHFGPMAIGCTSCRNAGS